MNGGINLDDCGRRQILNSVAGPRVPNKTWTRLICQGCYLESMQWMPVFRCSGCRSRGHWGHWPTTRAGVCCAKKHYSAMCFGLWSCCKLCYSWGMRMDASYISTCTLHLGDQLFWNSCFTWLFVSCLGPRTQVLLRQACSFKTEIMCPARLHCEVYLVLWHNESSTSILGTMYSPGILRRISKVFGERS